MKKSILLFIAPLFLSVFGTNNVNTIKADSLVYDYNQYNHYQQFWNSDIIYNETVTFVQESDYQTVSARCVYDIDQIISIKDYNMKNDLNLNLFNIVGNKIVIKNVPTPPVEPKWITYENMVIPESTLSGNTYLKYVGYTQASIPGTSPTRNIIHTEDIGISRMQYLVTYKKKSTSTWTGYTPTAQPAMLKNTISKLSSNSNINICFYGDSITTGAMSSGFLNSERAAHPERYSSNVNTDYLKTNEPIFSNSFKNELVRIFGYSDASKINLTNTAVGGTTSTWGLENVQANVVNYHPDLAILGFGTNDGCSSIQVPVATYKSNMQGMIDAIRADKPNCEIILIHGIKSNPDSPNHTYMQNQYITPLNEIASANANTTVLNMYSLMEGLYTKKLPIDMLANNINHPSDWLERVYTSCLLTLLGVYGDDSMSSKTYTTFRSTDVRNLWGSPLTGTYDYGDNGCTIRYAGNASYGHRVTLYKQVQLDGLSLTYRGADLTSSSLQTGFYFSASPDCKFFSEVTSPVFSIYPYIGGSNHDGIIISNDNDYVANKCVYYRDENLTLKGFGQSSADCTMAIGHDDGIGVNFTFKKITDSKYKVIIKEIIPNTFMNANQQQYTYVDGSKAFVGYLDTSSRNGMVDSNGRCYINSYMITNGCGVSACNIFYNVISGDNNTSLSTVSFYDGNNIYQKKTAEISSKLAKPANPSRSGYTFMGWYKESSFTNAWNFSSDTVTSSTTKLYAKFLDTKAYHVESFINNYMHPEIPFTDTRDTKACLNYYPSAKTAYNTLTNDEKTLFSTSSTYKNYYLRLQSWAVANGEVINGINISSAAKSIGTNNDDNGLLVLILISSFAILGGVLFLAKSSKKKEF